MAGTEYAIAVVISEADKKKIHDIFDTVRERGVDGFYDNPLSDFVKTYGFDPVADFIYKNWPEYEAGITGYEWDAGSPEEASINQPSRLQVALEGWLEELKPEDNSEQESMESYMGEIAEGNIGEARRWDLWKQALEQSTDDPELRAKQVRQIRFVAAYLRTSALDVKRSLDQLFTSDESMMRFGPPMSGEELAQNLPDGTDYSVAYELARYFYYTYKFGPNSVEALRPFVNEGGATVVQDVVPNRLAFFILQKKFYEVEITARLDEAQTMREELETFLLLEATGNAVRTKDPEKLAEARTMIYIASSEGIVPADMLKRIESMLPQIPKDGGLDA